jgi:hypothetical protein
MYVFCILWLLFIKLSGAAENCTAFACQFGCCKSPNECATNVNECDLSCYDDRQCGKGCCNKGVCLDEETCHGKSFNLPGAFVYFLIVALTIVTIGIFLHYVNKQQKKKKMSRTRNLIGVGQIVNPRLQIKIAQFNDNESSSMIVENLDHEEIKNTLRKPEPAKHSAKVITGYQASTKLQSINENIPPEVLEDYDPYRSQNRFFGRVSSNNIIFKKSLVELNVESGEEKVG